MPSTDYLFVQRVLQSPGVRRRLAEVAARKAGVAVVLAAQDNENVQVVTSAGTRPQGRPFARVSVPAVNEFGDSKTKRLRLLARVVNR
jgi:hypothetical protein